MASIPQRLSRLDLPGFTLPLNYTPHRAHSKRIYDPEIRMMKTVDIPASGGGRELFPSALSPAEEEDGGGPRSQLPLTTLREFTMIQVINHITDKPDWETKVFEQKIVDNWQVELQKASESGGESQEASQSRSGDISPAMFRWIVQELRYKAEIFAETQAISLYNGEVVKSDFVVSEKLKEALKSEVAPLENIPDVYKDYHPGSDDKVIDLVHPSLFPLIYGRSRILPDKLVGLDDSLEMIGQGKPLTIPSEEDAKCDDFTIYGRQPSTSPYSRNYQWLPCEVEFSGSDGEVKIVSYINNLHPKKHQDLYAVIEKIISHAIPLWNLTLTPLKDSQFRWKRIEFSSVQYEPDPDSLSEEDQPQREENESENNFQDRIYQWKDEFRLQHLVQPEPGIFKLPLKTKKTHAAEAVDLERDYHKSGLQVIVKLATICLTPEKSSYEGGSWHVEGQMNEHICATALYYYDSTNITESHLAFRQQSREEDTIDLGYEQNDSVWSGPIFGIENDDACVQNIGSVVCKEGRLITFPNILQHRVLPFELEDKTKPGHRKILALFLVDPNIRIISTANVPPQQRDWWSEELKSRGFFKQMATELQDKIYENVDNFPIGMEEAKEIRLKLMDERKDYVALQDGGFKSVRFSLCEH